MSYNCFTRFLSVSGYYGNEIDGAAMPKPKGKKRGGDGEEEETELIHNSSDEDMEDDGDLTSVAMTPPMKPVITDRSELRNKTPSCGDNECSWGTDLSCLSTYKGKYILDFYQISLKFKGTIYSSLPFTSLWGDAAHITKKFSSKCVSCVPQKLLPPALF